MRGCCGVERLDEEVEFSSKYMNNKKGKEMWCLVSFMGYDSRLPTDTKYIMNQKKKIRGLADLEVYIKPKAHTQSKKIS